MHLLNPAPFGRILPAMVTPMKADGTVDFEAAQSLAKQLVADGADGLVVNGTTGESPVTHMEEKVELVRAVKEVVDVPVISGAGSNDTAHTVRMRREPTRCSWLCRTTRAPARTAWSAITRPSIPWPRGRSSYMTCPAVPD